MRRWRGSTNCSEHHVSGEHAARSRAVRYAVDVSDLARRITVPTLVLHARDDAVVPFDEGRTNR